MDAVRKIIHIDMDAFFASVEQRDNPDFRGKPLIVGGNPGGRGVVAACSYEARRFGIHSAMPCARAYRQCPDAIFTRPRLQHYREVSREVMAIFHEYTPLVEPLSLDEAYLDVTASLTRQPSATRLAHEICERIYKELHLTASAGVSYNKFLAKVASDINKPHGITTIPPDLAQSFLDTLPIRKFHGVGKVTEKKMVRLGINKGSDLRAASLDTLELHFGKTGRWLYDIVRGKDDRAVEPERIRKSIGTETTLAEDTADLATVHLILEQLCAKLCQAIERHQACGHTLSLKLRYDDFSTITRSITVRHAVQSQEAIMSILPRLLHATEAGGRKVRLLGLTLSNLQDSENTPYQLPLPFPPHPSSYPASHPSSFITSKEM